MAPPDLFTPPPLPGMPRGGVVPGSARPPLPPPSLPPPGRSLTPGSTGLPLPSLPSRYPALPQTALPSPRPSGGFASVPPLLQAPPSTNTGFEVQSVTREELAGLRRAARRGWLLTVLAVAALGAGGYFGLEKKRALDGEVSRLRNERNGFERRVTDLAAALSISKTDEKESATKISLLTVAAEANKKHAAAQQAATVSAEALATALRADLAGQPVQILAAEGVVTLSFNERVLFAGNDTAPGLDGFRVLFRLGKALKAVTDRRIVVVSQASLGTPKAAGKSKGAPLPLDLAAGRAASLIRFLTDDLALDPAIVGARLRAPRKAAKGKVVPSIEIVLETQSLPG